MPVEPVTLDVRPDLAAGKEPFSRIMTAARNVPPEGTLVVLAPFEPEPLYPILGRMGFTHESQPLADGSWRIVFLRHADA
jgi:hypothetical protein